MSGIYDEFYRSLLKAEIDVTTVTIKAVLIDVDDVGMSVTGATNTNPIEITTASAHGLTTGNRVSISGVGGNTAANKAWRVTVVDTTHFTLDGSTGSGPYSSGGFGIDLSNHQFYSDIAVAGRVSEITVANVTVSEGATIFMDADDLTFVGVEGDTCEAVLLYYSSGVEVTSTLICILDENTVSGIPVTPGGGNIDVTFHANGIIRFN